MSLNRLHRPQPVARTRPPRGVVVTAWLGSAGDPAAAGWSARYAASTGRRLVVLVTGSGASPGDDYRAELARACGAPCGLGALDLDVLESTGSPLEALLAASRLADVLVLPTDGPAPVADRPLGRTLEEAVTRSFTPVVIVPGLYRQDRDGAVVVGADVDRAIIDAMRCRAPIVRASTPSGMIAASRSAALVVARCHRHEPGSWLASCRALQVARSSWSPLVAVHS